MIQEGLGALKKKIAKILREYKALDRARTCGAQCVTVVRSRKEVQIDVDGTVTAVLAAAEDYCRVCGHEKAELTRLYFFERKTEVAVSIRLHLSLSTLKRMKSEVTADILLLAAAAGAFPYEEILSEFKRRKDD